jgi:hypothetical protein
MREATVTTVRVFGTIMGLAGLEHGIGEILEGNRIIPEIIFRSWPDSDYFRIMNGEPALSILPTYLQSGILTILASIAFILFATAFVKRKGSWIVLMLLAVVMLLVGGGLFPPVLGFIVAVLASRIHVPIISITGQIHDHNKPFLAANWRGITGFSILAWLCLMPGMNFLSHFSLGDYSALMGIIVLVAIGSFALASIASRASDGWDSRIHPDR